MQRDLFAQKKLKVAKKMKKAEKKKELRPDKHRFDNMSLGQMSEYMKG